MCPVRGLGTAVSGITARSQLRLRGAEMWCLAVLEPGGGSAFKEHRNVSRGGVGGCEGKECAVRGWGALRAWKLRWG